MSIRISQGAAKQVLFLAAEEAEDASSIPSEWERSVRDLSQICDETRSKTHIAFLGTAMLAKSTDRNVDVWSVKVRAGTPGAYSARSLAQHVLAANSRKLGIHLGVTGREPLNNQPYFRIDRVSQDMPVRTKEAVAVLCTILEKLEKIDSREDARATLRAFIKVRREYAGRTVHRRVLTSLVTEEDLIALIERFVSDDSEGGKRAQAVVSGLVGLIEGVGRVETSRINDPDRHFPGDVGVRNVADPQQWDMVFEVRDKTVPEHDLLFFLTKAAEKGIGKAGLIAVAGKQEALPISESSEWGRKRGVSLTVYHGWAAFVRQVLFWSRLPQAEASKEAFSSIWERLHEMEVSAAGIDLWSNA